MASNSKLTKAQKQTVKAYMQDIADAGGSVGTAGRFTVIIMPEFPGSKMARMSVSVASRDEKKLRRKVGIYHAMTRMYDNQSVPLPTSFDALNMADFMNDNYG